MKLSQVCLLAVVILSTVACGKVPSAYQGNFEDASTNTKLTLDGNAWTYDSPESGHLEGKAVDMSFDDILAGKSGVYVAPNPQNNQLSDVKWILPNLSSQQEAVLRNGTKVIWFNAEVIYTLVDASRKEDVSEINLVHCKNGIVQFALDTKNFISGCPAGTPILSLKRKK